MSSDIDANASVQPFTASCSVECVRSQGGGRDTALSVQRVTPFESAAEAGVFRVFRMVWVLFCMGVKLGR